MSTFCHLALIRARCSIYKRLSKTGISRVAITGSRKSNGLVIDGGILYNICNGAGAVRMMVVATTKCNFRTFKY